MKVRFAIAIVALIGCGHAASPGRATMPPGCSRRYQQPVGDTPPLFVRFKVASDAEVDAMCMTVDDAGTVLAGMRSDVVSSRAVLDAPVRLAPGRHRLRLRVVGRGRVDVDSSDVVEVPDESSRAHASLAAVTAILRDDGRVVWSTTVLSDPAAR